MLRRRSSRPALARACKAIVESLESRRYFVTLTGNSTFVMHDPEVDPDVPRQIEINTTGNITVELVGSSPDQFGGIDLVNIPGVLNGQNILGGLAGAGGVKLLEASGADGIDIVDPNNIIPGFPGIPFDVAGSDQINFRALAADSGGTMYGIDVFDQDSGGGGGAVRRAALVRFDNPTTTLEATVIAELNASILTPPTGTNIFAPGDDPAQVTGVTAAAFNPIDGLLYFVACGGVNNRPQLYSLNVNAGSNAAINASVVAFAGNFGATNGIDDDGALVPNANNTVVNSITFDQTGAGTARAIASITRDETVISGGGQQVDIVRRGRLIIATSAATLPSTGATRQVTFAGDSVTNVTGIEFQDDNPNAVDNLLFFITATNTTESGLVDGGGTGGGGGGGGGGTGTTVDPRLFQGDLSVGGNGDLPLLTIGLIEDPADTVDPIRGQDLQGLTWNPDVPDPLTGGLGAFVAVDATSDEMVVISTARRAPDADLFHIYISSADENATISVMATEVIANQLVSLPYTFAPKFFNAVGAEGGGVVVAPDLGIGRVWIGGRTGALGAIFDPWIQGDVTQAFGSLPITSGTLTAGISSAPNTSIGNILIGGAVTGQVNITGSISTFYAGWILTGNAEGATLGDPGTSPLPQEGSSIDTRNNFFVGGDATSIISQASIGTDSLLADDTVNYSSDFDAEVNGEVGHFQSYDSIVGGLQVSNTPGAGRDTSTPLREYETHTGSNTGNNFRAGLLGSAGADTAFLYNDTLDNPQYLSTIGDDNLNGYIQVTGALDDITDVADTYAVGLMSGQTYIFQISSGGLLVYDPDGRLVASDSSHFGANSGQPFKFTTDRPGIYKLQAVGGTPYTLTVRNAGSISIGGITAVNEIYNARTSGAQNQSGGLVDPNDPNDATTYLARHGDIGAIFAGGLIAFAGGYTYQRSQVNFSGRDDIRVDDGDLRSLDGGQVGLGINLNGFGPDIDVTKGNIGLLRARSSLMNIETAIIGGTLQAGDAAGTGYIQLSAKGGMGVFRAGDMASEEPSIFRVDSDDLNFDGLIGLIDCIGDFGILTGSGPVGNFVENFQVVPSDADINPLIPGGGPQISTGTGGDVRYIRVGGNVYPDIFFGGNEPEGTPALATATDDNGAAVTGVVGLGGGTLYDAGISLNFNDDGGGKIRLSPVGLLTPNPAFDPANPPPENEPVAEFLGPQLGVRAYGIRSGGVVLMSVDVSGTDVQGLIVNGSNTNGSVQIGTVTVAGTATALSLNSDGVPILPGGPTTISGSSNSKGPLVIGPDGLPVNRGNNSTALDVNQLLGVGQTAINGGGVSVRVPNLGTAAQAVVISYTGSSRVDVFETSAGNITRLSNTTGGEMPIINATDIAELTSVSTIGLADKVLGVGIVPAVDLAIPTGGGTTTTYPFDQQGIGVVANNVGFIRAQQSLGNLIISGAANQIVANAGGSDNAAMLEGITAPILVVGNIGLVQIGEGLTPSGSGAVAWSGIFGGGIIYNIANQNGGDIMGDINAVVQIRNIRLTNGSIINSDISVANNADFGMGSGGGGLLQNTDTTFSSRTYPLGNIVLTGKGGIIGSRLVAADIGTIDVDGFGIFTTDIQALNLARIREIKAANYGIRYVNINAGGSLDTLNATGNGNSVSTAKFGQSVRYSETQPVDDFFDTSFDPYFGTAINMLTDIHSVLGTSAQVPEIEGVTDTGVIENVDARGGRALNTVSAYQIRTRQLADVPIGSVTFQNQFNFASNIGTIKTLDRIDGLAITTARLGNFKPGSDVFRLLASISSQFKNIDINGSLGSDSIINVLGFSGSIGSVNIDGDLDGTLHATQSIGSVYVRGNTTGEIRVDNLNSSKTNIKSLTAAGGIGADNLTIAGSIGKIIIGSGAALTGNTLTVNGNLGSVQINGGVLTTDLVINGNLGSATIAGTLQGDLTVRDDAGSITVKNAGGTSVDSVQGNVSIGGSLKSFTVTGGNVRSNITVGGDFNSFKQTNGGIGSSASGTLAYVGNTISAGEKFGAFKTTGQVIGTLAAGTFGNVQIGADWGDSLNGVGLTASEMTALVVAGTVRGGVTATIAGTLGKLAIGGNVDAGAVIAAGAINKKDIKGTVSGVVTP